MNGDSIKTPTYFKAIDENLRTLYFKKKNKITHKKIKIKRNKKPKNKTSKVADHGRPPSRKPRESRDGEKNCP